MQFSRHNYLLEGVAETVIKILKTRQIFLQNLPHAFFLGGTDDKQNKVQKSVKSQKSKVSSKVNLPYFTEIKGIGPPFASGTST